MTRSPARGRAGGKVILLGEHAVVYGRPAVAAGLPIGLEAEAMRGDGPRLESEVTAGDARGETLVADAARAVGLEPGEWRVRVRSELAPGQGLGSSAALCIAVLRALATEGIQKGHMALHARAVSHAAGARGDEAEELRQALIENGEIKIDRARELLRSTRDLTT